MLYMCVMTDLQLERLPETFRRRLGLQPQHFHVPQFGFPVPPGHSFPACKRHASAISWTLRISDSK